MSVFFALGLGVEACAVAAFLTGRLPDHLCCALIAIPSLLLGIDAVRRGSRWALLDAALCALWVREWWRGGGGDDTRRRLRDRFKGVRRTAPATA